MPPSTTPARTRIVSRSAKSGVTSGFWTVSITATTAASTPEISTAAPITRPARTPSSSAVRKSIAAARMCSPTRVRPSSRTRTSRQTAASTVATIAILRMSTPEIVTGWFNVASDAAILPSGPNHSNAMLCKRNATAKVATSITAGDLPAQRPEDDPVHEQREQRERPRSTGRCPTETGQPRSEAKASAYAPAITSCPYAKLTSRSTPKTSPMPTAMSA